MVEIIPAIIPEDYEDLTSKLARIRGLASYVQIDILDGLFVPEKSWPLTPEGRKKLSDLRHEEEGLPFWEDFLFEADLMVESPEKIIEDIIFAGFSRIIVHAESTDSFREIIEKARETDTEIGIAIGADTPSDDIEEWIEHIDFVQYMGIEEIGFQGQPFSPKVLEHISSLRARHPHLIISVDGGVTLDSAPLLIRAGVDRLVSGSTIFESGDPKQAIEQLMQSH